MRNFIAATLLGLAFATPAGAQVPDVGRLLQGLTNGNQGQDQALRDAFERGYQRGRQDEARLRHSGSSGGDSRYDRRNLDRNGRPYDHQNYPDEQRPD